MSHNIQIIVGIAVVVAALVIPKLGSLKSTGSSILSMLISAFGGKKTDDTITPSPSASTGGKINTLQELHGTISNIIDYFRGDEEGVMLSAAVGQYAYKKKIADATREQPLGPTPADNTVVPPTKEEMVELARRILAGVPA